MREPVSVASSSIGVGREILLSTFLDRGGEEVQGALDLRGNEGVILGALRSRRMTGLAGGIGIDVAALQQIVEAADAIPAIAVAFQQQRVPAALVGVAVIFGQQIDQKLAGLAGKPDRKRKLARLLVEIVHEQHRIVAPVVADDQHGGIARSRSP